MTAPFRDEALTTLQTMLNTDNKENPWLGVVASVALLQNRARDLEGAALTNGLQKKVEAPVLVEVPIPMLLWCPKCQHRHVDRGEYATKPHHTHACQNCGLVWRPALVYTVGVGYLPGFEDEIVS